MAIDPNQTDEQLRAAMDELAQELNYREQQRALAEAEAISRVSLDNPKLRAALDADIATLLGDNTVAGSIRSWRSTVSNTYDAAVLRALGSILISVVQVLRLTLRQTIRISGQVSHDFSATSGIAEDPTPTP